MTSAVSYRKIAAELRARALKAPNARTAADFDNLARAYLRLAEQAEQNSLSDIWAEFGPQTRMDSEGEGA